MTPLYARQIESAPPATGKTEQLTSFKKFDSMFPGMGPDEIVFSAGPDLYLFDLKTEKERKISAFNKSGFLLGR